MREGAGDHSYDGVVPDLSPAGVASALARIGRGAPPPDAHDAAHLRCAEEGLRWRFGQYEAHRRDPLVHISHLDLACYDRPYAPAEERAAARARHLAGWPDAVDAACEALDAVPSPVADALLGAAIGLRDGLDPQTDTAGRAVVEAALNAHGRLVAHLERARLGGDPQVAVGGECLASALGTFDGLDVDLGALAQRADAERDRLRELLTEACERLAPGEPMAEVLRRSRADHPDIDGVLAEARSLTAEVLEFSAQHDLVPWTDGECVVEPAPPSRSWAMAMMSWAGPYEDDAPSQYYVTPPDPRWPAQDIEDWLAVFSRTSLPAITVHEVCPGHYAHGRALRRAATPVRRRLALPAFTEGWAHYAEEMVSEIGFRRDDPRYLVGVGLEALVRVTRLRASIGMHTGAMSVEQATEEFVRDAHLAGPAAHSEAARGTFDLGYGCYTLGKLMLLDLREEARSRWGANFTLPRFHRALLALGSPPLGLIGHALSDDGRSDDGLSDDG